MIAIHITLENQILGRWGSDLYPHPYVLHLLQLYNPVLELRKLSWSFRARYTHNGQQAPRTGRNLWKRIWVLRTVTFYVSYNQFMLKGKNPQTQKASWQWRDGEKKGVTLAGNKYVKLMIHNQPSGGPDMIRIGFWPAIGGCVVTVQMWGPLSSQSSS